MSYYRPEHTSSTAEYSAWPVPCDRYCNVADGCCGASGGGGGVDSRAAAAKIFPDSGCEFRAKIFPGEAQRIPCKNGEPYDCNCNLIDAPYSMAYEARWNGCNCKRPGCKNDPAPGPGTWYVQAPYFMKRT